MIKKKLIYAMPVTEPLALQAEKFLCLSFNTLELTEYLTSDPDEVDL